MCTGSSAGRVGSVLPPVKGVEVELDEVEVACKLYHSTPESVQHATSLARGPPHSWMDVSASFTTTN